MKKGKLIVCEGIDGSGKHTQVVLLEEAFKRKGYPVVIFDFPRYGDPPRGHPASYFVRKYLRKEEFGFSKGYGNTNKVFPYAASSLYALDRFDAAYCKETRPNLIDYLESGHTVLSNRYTEANIGHQASKINNLPERKKFIEWLLNYEYEILKIPKPDLVLLFNMPPAIAIGLKEKQRKEQNIKKDAHEKDSEGLEKSHWAYLEAAKMFPDSWVIINIHDEKQNRLLAPEKIHEIVWREIQKRL